MSLGESDALLVEQLVAGLKCTWLKLEYKIEVKGEKKLRD